MTQQAKGGEAGGDCGLREPHKPHRMHEYELPKTPPLWCYGVSKSRIVAECWTCRRCGCAKSDPCSNNYRPAALASERCRAAGHDVRPVEVKP